MDYNLQTLLITLVAESQLSGSGGGNLTNFANDLFDRFDALIVRNAAAAGLSFDAEQRTVIASVAMLLGGAPADAAKDAIASWVDVFGN